MNTPVRLLHLEDDPADAELILASLRREGFLCVVHRIETRAAFGEALEQGGFDLILADYQLPAFDGLSALGMARTRRPEVPFLFVSGFIGEEAALDSLKNGATDYVFKHNLARLAPALRRAFDEARRRHEREQVEAILRSFYDAAPFLMGVVELLPRDILHLSGNAASARFFGAAPEAMRMRRSSDFGVPVEAIQEWLEKFREAQFQGSPVEFEHAYARDGKPRWLLVTVASLPVTAGQPPRFCYIAEDTTDKRQLEQQFLRTQRLESVGTLAGGIAHDLNNVLAPILMALPLFRPKLPDREDQELLNNLESSARRGADIIRQVLTFARGVEGARRPLQFQPLVGELEKMLRDTFPRSMQIQVLVPEDLWRVVGDSTQIYQVLMNLCVNARDAMPAGGQLLISVENHSLDAAAARRHPDGKAGGYVRLRVRDTGDGIAPEIFDKIFDPFFTTKEVGRGTGLGLSTVLTIVKSHGGFMSVTSEPGQGADFQVYLPVDKSAPLPAVEPEPTETGRGQGECILVVDDEPVIRQITRATLVRHGYRVLTAKDGAEAVIAFQTGRQQGAAIRLVLTDLMMPVMDGPELIRSLRQMDPHVKIVATSGLLDVAAVGELQRESEVAFLQKPFSAEKLLQTVGDVLHSGTTPRLL